MLTLKKIHIIFLASTFVVLVFVPSVKAQLSTNDTLNPVQLVQNILLGSGVTASNITYNGAPLAIGSFNGTVSNIGLSSGIIMTSGHITNAVGPNNLSSAYTDNNLFGDIDLDSIMQPTLSYDAAILEFDFIAISDTVEFHYVFGSEEYMEYVSATPGGINDGFGFFISGPGITGPFSNNSKNIALIPGTTLPVTMFNLNLGSYGAYYFDNGNGNGSGTAADGLTVQYDGFTVPLTAISEVQCGQVYHLKIAIADGGDRILDSGVFLEAGSFASSGGTQNCVLVWPGDTDNNYIVDNNDLLPIGLHYGQMGIPRSSISNLWQGDSSASWGIIQANGSEIKHVDCNGDAVIDNNDTLAINLNFNLTHAIVPPVIHNTDYNRQLATMYFVTTNTYYNAGDWVDAELWLGDSIATVDSLYGIAFNIYYDASMVQPGTETLTYPENTWLGTIGTDAIKIAKVDPLATTAYGAITRIDHINKSGYGKIADFKFQIKTSLTAISTMPLSILNYSANDSAGIVKVFNTQIDSILINQMTTSIIESDNGLGFSIYPNPFTLQATMIFDLEQKNRTIKIIDVLGKVIKTINFSGKQYIIEKGEIKEGFYFIQVLDENKNVFNRKIVIR